MRPARQREIVSIVRNQPLCSISIIKERLLETVSIPTLNRELAYLVSNRVLVREGSGRALKYRLADSFCLFYEIDLESYFAKNVDNRNAHTEFSADLLSLIARTSLLTSKETNDCELLQREFQKNVQSIPSTLYKKEMERLTIELSWKSSQIEGNTYSLLETELLLKDRLHAAGRSPEEATMLLNHKSCLEYILQNKSLGSSLNISMIEDLHTILTTELQVERSLRRRSVGITGCAYKPLDNQYQIREATSSMCSIVNVKTNVFERALVALLLISYIQPFEDGNKRTGRMVSNSILIAGDACPLSYRSVDPITYKEAMLVFYEQHSVSAFKELFLQQAEFAARNYFR